MSILRLYSNNKAGEKELDDFENIPIAEIYKNYIRFKNNQEQRYSIKDIYNLKKRQIAELLSISYKPDFSMLRNVINNTKEILEKLKYSLIDVRIKTSSKTFIGVSTQFGFTIFESGISFDPIFNAPYIPASEIKGILRSYIEDKDKRLVEKLFGTENNEGLLMITDAFPISAERNTFLPEIITPHYTSNVKQETEVNPNPVILLAIAPGVTFEFLVYYKDQNLDDKEKKIIKELICKMSKEGIGAKTTLGFSQFTVNGISWSVKN
ncbi:CRISPR-associated RAMP protein, Cmr6 family [Sulfolobus islandicus Y.G.57.14]|uniref:CRISPR-associated RAMP protein, Cmr6 family n=1 Tax=Saccharolobus islandicus (strain Y.G.57.14 / Yellowstone \|nr:type III-B CRISPR module RAMP protein Cmr6 [Sulfolobus islandicus]ACP44984.1 CRISPR-associated RAMP protein, Cmr6 family [Sulfolobus islandicus Y.G.57.14]